MSDKAVSRENGVFSQGEEEVEVEGHLIDSMILTRIWARIMELGGDFEVLDFRVGRHKAESSSIRMVVKAETREKLDQILQNIYQLGAIPIRVRGVNVVAAATDGVLPDGFYSTTNNPTSVNFEGEWIGVDGIMMDKVIVVDPDSRSAYCKPMRDVKKGDLIVVGEEGVKVKPPERPRESGGIFSFMASEVSSEKPATTIIRKIAQDIRRVKGMGGRIAVVAGPAIVHTGASNAFAGLVRDGFVDVLLAGNALAVHDVESALLQTSLGVSLEEGTISVGGNRNHLVAINEIYKAGSLEAAVEKGVLRSGIIYECLKRGVPFVLAGSIRDDGPLPEVVTDTVVAQRRYMECLKGVSMVLMLATTLHSIAVGNMLPSTVKLVCVDISPANVTKLLDRGSTQAVGIVTDIGTFLPLLAQELDKLNS